MPFNPYAKLAQLADFAGAGEAASAARVGARAQSQVQQTGGRVGKVVGGAVKRTGEATKDFKPNARFGAIAGRNSQSLPGVRDSNGVSGQGRQTPGQRNAQGIEIQAPYIVPVGSPSVRVTARDNGTVITNKKYFSLYTPFISPADWGRVKRVLAKIKRKAEQLSKGRLTLKKLAKLNHPYGKGGYRPHSEGLTGRALKRRKRRGLGRLTRLAGVSNLAVVNKQSGRFERSWFSGIRLIKARGRATGVELFLVNLSPVAEYLAFATKRMRAHGPFLTAFQLYKTEIDRLWREVTRRAWTVAGTRWAESRRRADNLGAAVI